MVCQYGHLALVKLLLRKEGILINHVSNGSTALIEAAAKGHQCHAVQSVPILLQSTLFSHAHGIVSQWRHALQVLHSHLNVAHLL